MKLIDYHEIALLLTKTRFRITLTTISLCGRQLSSIFGQTLLTTIGIKVQNGCRFNEYNK